jgi:hypothetical protein
VDAEGIWHTCCGYGSRCLRPFCQRNCFSRSQMRIQLNARYANGAAQQIPVYLVATLHRDLQIRVAGAWYLTLIRKLRSGYLRYRYVSLRRLPFCFLHSNQKDLVGTSAQFAPGTLRHERENSRCRRRIARGQESGSPLPNPNPSELETCRDICALRLDTHQSVPLRPAVACINLPGMPQELKRRFANDADRVDRRIVCTIQECTHQGNC